MKIWVCCLFVFGNISNNGKASLESFAPTNSNVLFEDTTKSSDNCHRPCKFNVKPKRCLYKFKIEPSIPTDGPPALTINGMTPGPAVLACTNDIIVVQVENKVPSQDLTIHWHGLEQKGTPFMDGTPMVTQCPIGYGSTYKYTFVASAPGTFFYHADSVATIGTLQLRPSIVCQNNTRKHMPCAAHLPLHCSFDIVEMDLQPPYVTKEALRNFSDELERRARARARQERHERRRERAHRRATEGPPRPDFTSELVFPAPTYTSPPSSYCGPPSSYCDPPASYCDPPASYCGPPASNSRPTSGQSQADVQESSPSTSVGSPPSGLSFAKMASTSGTWRVRAAPPPPPPAAAAEEAACEGGAPRPLSLSDAIEAALLAAPAPSAKKNKKKQKILFATAMQRAP